jgi:hypothetical protein
MAKELKQSVTQYNIDEFVAVRTIVQFVDSETAEESQVIVNYSDLSAEEKATFDAYETLCETLMNK